MFPRELEGQSGSPPWSPGAPKVGEWLVWSLSDPSGRKRRHRREQQGLVSPPEGQSRTSKVSLLERREPLRKGDAV